MKKGKLIIILIGLFLFFMSSGDMANAKQKLIFGNMASPRSVMVQGFEWWETEIEKRTQHQVIFDNYWGASLVKAYEQTSAVINNVIQVGSLSSYNPDISPFPQILTSPMLNTGSAETALRAADELFRKQPEIQKWLKANNLKYMFQGIYTNQYVWSKIPINTLSDFKGLTIRTFGPFLSLFKALGSSLLSVPVPEMYNALDRGVVKATTQYLTLAIGFKIPEVTKYLIKSNLGHIPLPIVMNINAWNKLPDSTKKVIKDINTNQMIPKFKELDNINHEKEIKIAKDHGMKLSELSSSDIKKLREIAREKVWKPYEEKLETKGIPGSKIFQHYIKLIDKYSKR